MAQDRKFRSVQGRRGGLNCCPGNVPFWLYISCKASWKSRENELPPAQPRVSTRAWRKDPARGRWEGPGGERSSPPALKTDPPQCPRGPWLLPGSSSVRFRAGPRPGSVAGAHTASTRGTRGSCTLVWLTERTRGARPAERLSRLSELMSSASPASPPDPPPPSPCGALLEQTGSQPPASRPPSRIQPVPPP